MSWIILFAAGLLEIGWAIGLKYSDGFTKLWPSVATVISLLGSMLLLGWSLKSLPIGTAYAIWVGIGVIGTTLLGLYCFGESMSLLKAVSVGFICVGIMGLKLSAS